ncbi:Tm-1-like ATP-binding domain-containing protein [Rosistilla oblonga]|uniref:Tm-1-like ATP-binding domain-containing protein n=1 Tax=Rosistilla oblonga TaxID=2527990 RepID=UPI003A9851AC
MASAVYAVGTMDTKGEELAYVKECLRSAGIRVKMVDVGTQLPPTVTPDVTRAQVAENSDFGSDHDDRGRAVAAMGRALEVFLTAEFAAGRVSGVIGIGGSGGTSLVTAAMRALPIGLPKVMVSTVASGNTAPYVDCSDITMMYSVVDVAGLNVVSRRILANAAHAVAGMVQYPAPASDQRPTVGMTMFGVTTPCVTDVRQRMEQRGFDCHVFHATGTGGRAMERLVDNGMIRGVLDVTTTEVADEVVGGVFAAGPKRFNTLIGKGIPYVVSLGAVDMVNFGAMETVPAEFRDRRLHVHNDQVTLMRTTAEENREIARWMGAKFRRATAPLVLVIPEGGLSMLDAPGMPFHDPEANAALFDELQKQLQSNENCRIVRLPHHINDVDFSAKLVEHYDCLDAMPKCHAAG